MPLRFPHKKEKEAYVRGATNKEDASSLSLQKHSIGIWLKESSCFCLAALPCICTCMASHPFACANQVIAETGHSSMGSREPNSTTVTGDKCKQGKIPEERTLDLQVGFLGPLGFPFLS